MSQVIIFTNDKGIKSVTGIQIGILDRHLTDGVGIIFDQFFLCRFFFYLIFEYKIQFAGKSGDFFDGIC